MREIKTDIIINANREVVWQHFTNFNNYNEWNPLIKSIKGNIEQDKTIEVDLELEGRKPMKFEPQLLKVEANQEFRWKGKLGFKGIFDGEHYFIFEKVNDTTTRLIHGEKFTGIFVPLIMGSIKESTLNGFKAMNIALKNLVEN
jgi:hypothetical protein